MPQLKHSDMKRKMKKNEISELRSHVNTFVYSLRVTRVSRNANMALLTSHPHNSSQIQTVKPLKHSALD